MDVRQTRWQVNEGQHGHCTDQDAALGSREKVDQTIGNPPLLQPVHYVLHFQFIILCILYMCYHF